jgi:drug/metabolite transporter (DMT)-like permease
MNNFLNRYRGILIALFATTVWATTAIFISYLLNNFNLRPLTLAFWRDLSIGGLLFVIFLFVQPAVLRISRRDLPFYIGYGFIGLAVFNGMWAYSVHFNGAAVATVLAYSSPAFTVLLAWPILKEAWTAKKLVAVVLSFVGCIFVAKAYSADQWQLNPLGIIFGLATGLAFAFYNLAGRWSARHFASPWTVTTYGFLFAALGLGLTQRFDFWTPASTSEGIFFANPAFSMGTAWQGWIVLGILVIPSVLGFGMYTLSLRYLQASVAGLIASLEPVLTALMAIFILKESLEDMQWLGSALIVSAVVLVQSKDETRETIDNQAPAIDH